ncbi:hypothetical protein MKY51_07830 [Solibacillus sp. FSL R5-0691]|uniref:hypothetical protein n=1 Tax=Solibacillus sp. FSL R5-0691 TaxID=2921653 RepID=UPI0030CC8B84
MEKAKVGMILGIFSMLPVIISVIYFYSVRGPNSEIHRTIAVLTILSIIGLITAGITSWILKGRLSRLVIGLIGIIANLAVLVVAFLLLLAMGISEP